MTHLYPPRTTLEMVLKTRAYTVLYLLQWGLLGAETLGRQVSSKVQPLLRVYSCCVLLYVSIRTGNLYDDSSCTSNVRCMRICGTEMLTRFPPFARGSTRHMYSDRSNRATVTGGQAALFRTNPSHTVTIPYSYLDPILMHYACIDRLAPLCSCPCTIPAVR